MNQEMPADDTTTILVVEDDDAIRSLSCRVLRAAGYAVLDAPNGAEGLRIANADTQKAIRLVVTDIIMPEMHGTRLCEELQKSRPDVKVLFASGYPDEAASHPGVALLHKPFTSDALIREVRKTLDGAATKCLT